VPALRCIKITGQASRLAVRTNVDIYRRAIDTVEKRADNVLLTIKALDTGVLERLVRIVEHSNAIAIRSFRATVRLATGLYQERMDRMDIVHLVVTGEANRKIVAFATFIPIS
jgi:hypothetical protein